MVLFYFRFFLDAFFGATILFFFASSIASNFSAEEIVIKLIYLSGLLGTLVGRARAAVTLMITVERILVKLRDPGTVGCYRVKFQAVFTPIFYRNYRPLISNLAILSLIVGYGLFDYLIMRFLCDFKFVIPTNCITAGCSMNLCSSQYWATSKTVAFIRIFLNYNYLNFPGYYCVYVLICNNVVTKASLESYQGKKQRF